MNRLVEDDMRKRPSDGSFDEKVVAGYPLIGSRIIKSETLEKLTVVAQKNINHYLQHPMFEPSTQARRQITIAIINYAKEWKYEDNENFWGYICLKLGYRDSSGSIIRLLQKCVEDTMKLNGKYFIEDSNGRGFKSTVLMHALSTRKSWMSLLDFLFDFYKNNLDWKLIPGDPLLDIMVESLRQKLDDDDDDEMEIEISSSVYAFQVGIRKLIVNRPEYTRVLFEQLLRKIEQMINSVNRPVKVYEEQLCEEWFKEKITSISATKRSERQSQSGSRDIVIDYSKIKAKLFLRNNIDLQLILPDIRLLNENSSDATMKVFYNDRIVYQHEFAWYGNELGKTLKGINISLPAFKSSEMNIRVCINCDNKTIYDSGTSLCQPVQVFYGNTAINASQMKAEQYTLVLPSDAVVDIEHADITVIDEFKNEGLKAWFVELGSGFILTVNGKLFAFDNTGGTDFKVITPSESLQFPTISTGDGEQYFSYRGSSCSIILGDQYLLKQYIVLKNNQRIEFSELNMLDNSNGLAFDCPIDGDDVCRIQVIDLETEKLLFDRSFVQIDRLEAAFNRPFYYSEEDYRDAEYTLQIDDVSEKVSFGIDDEEICIPYLNGKILVDVPKIVLTESTGKWMNTGTSAYYAGDIPQDSLLKVHLPQGTEVSFSVGNQDLRYDGQGIVTIGNVIRSLAGSEGMKASEFRMTVNGQNTYTLAKICFKEMFLNPIEFRTEGNRLYWNQGGGFIGKEGRAFTLLLSGNRDNKYEFNLDENTEYIDIPEDMPIGKYQYEISIISGGMFRRTKTILDRGECIIGDRNVLRFINCRIVIKAVTDDSREEKGQIPVDECYIDQIQFQEIQETSDGLCPVYRGVLFSVSSSGKRYQFSDENHVTRRGIEKTTVNPVRIVYIGENTLCITDQEKDGLYYYAYRDRELNIRRYALTDRKLTDENKHNFYSADLYIYKTERS